MRLNTFVALVALDDERRERFLNDPEAELAAAGLDLPAPVVKILERIAKIIDEGDFEPPGSHEAGGSGN